MIKIEVEKNDGTFGYFFEDSVWEQIVDGELVWPKKFVRYNTAFELEDGLEVTEEEYCDLILGKVIVVNIKVGDDGKKRLYYARPVGDSELKEDEVKVKLAQARYRTVKDNETGIEKGVFNFDFEEYDDFYESAEKIADLSDLPF